MKAATTELEIPVELHLSDGIQQRVQAQIVRVSAGFVDLSAPVALETGHEFDIMYLDRPIRCEIAYCVRERRDSYRVGARILGGNNGTLRAERRIRMDAPARLKTAGLAAPISVRVVDISSSGMGLQLGSAVSSGELAYVEMEHGVAFGEIRHCKKVDRGFRAGLFVEEFISRTVDATIPWMQRNREGSERTESFRLGRALITALLPKK